MLTLPRQAEGSEDVDVGRRCVQSLLLGSHEADFIPDTLVYLPVRYRVPSRRCGQRGPHPELGARQNRKKVTKNRCPGEY